MNMAKEVAKLSPDVETKVGAIMLSSEGRVIATGYNGFARGADDDSLPNKGIEKYDFMQHAERNLIYNCAYEGIRTKDTTIISTLSPCLHCVRAAHQSGIRTIIFDKLYRKFKDINVYLEMKDIWIDVEKIGDYTVLEISEVYS